MVGSNHYYTMEQQANGKSLLEGFPSRSELIDLIETAVGRAVTASISQLMLQLRSEFTAMSERISTLDNKLTLVNTEVLSVTADHSVRITALEKRTSELAGQSVSDSILLDQKVESISEVELAIQKLKETNKELHQTVDDLEQKTRERNLRITGLSVQTNSAVLEVCSFIRDKLDVQDFHESDITNVVLVNKKKTSSSTLSGLQSTLEDSSHTTRPTIIVTFVNKKIRDKILLKRRSLKGSHIGLSEDLTLLSSRFLAMCRKDTRVKSTWSWEGKLYLTLIKDEKKRRVFPFMTLDEQLVNI